MPKTYEYIYKVRGRGRFPLDMLRYDQCWPSREIDSHIIDGCEPGIQVDAVVEIKSHLRTGTAGRWKSFGWRVTDEEKRQR